MTETLPKKALGFLATFTLGASALTACSITSYNTDKTGVKCDGEQTEANLKNGDVVAFVVHGKHAGEVAVVSVRRADDAISERVTGDITGPRPQNLDTDGFTPPIPAPVKSGHTDLSAFAAGGIWILDVRNNNVLIQGTCDGM